MRLTLIALGLATFAAGVAPAHQGSRPADPLEDLFARGRAAQTAMRSLSASFTETTVSSLLVKPVVAKGTVIAAVNPLRVVMRYTSPEPRTVWIDDRTLAMSSPGRKALEEIGIADTQRRVQKYFASASLGDLRATFDLSLSAESAVPGIDVLEMVPKRRQIKEGLQRLRLWIDRERLLMVRMHMDFPGGDSKRVDFADVKINVPIDDQTFARPRAGRGGTK
jgi:outer membrane lipoprotein-sorting protein